MTSGHFTLTDSKNRKVFYRQWMPEQNLSGVIALVHGLGEHSGRYKHVADFFTGNGFGMLAADMYGHGETEGIRGHADSMEAYMDQIDHLLTRAKELAQEKPVFLYGHSMGGNLVLSYLFRHKPDIQGVIATAPAVRPGFNPPRLMLSIGRIARAIAPSFTQPNSLDLTNLSHDQQVIDNYTADPLVHNKVSGVVGLGIIEWGEWLLDHVKETTVPLLIMHGSEDKITSYEASKLFASQLTGDITFRSWDGLYHELHNEFQKQEVLKCIKDWVVQNLS